jgi:DNA invertase Pin-like site-specific DNA recombinase
MRLPDNCPFPPGSTVWGYLRDSGGESQDRSVDQQIAVFQTYCQKHQLVAERLFADEARTGDSAEGREQLWAMLDALRAAYPQIHDRRRRDQAAGSLHRGVVFWSFSRLGRDRLETAYIRSDLRLRGLIVASLADDILTGNELLDPVLEELIALQNEQFLASLSKDVRRGLHTVVALRDSDPGFLAHNPGWQPTGRYLGVFPGRVAPRGYTFERITVGQRRDGRLRTVQRLVPDPGCWQRALTAWRMRVFDGATHDEIQAATHLYARHNHLTNFFGNRIYVGVLEFGGEVYGSPGDPFVEPLIPPEWFETEAGRRRLRAGRRKKGGTADPSLIDAGDFKASRLLSGLLVCARCGAKLHADCIPAGVIRTTGKLRKAWPFYWCSAAKRGRCDAGKVSAPRLEEAVLARLKADIFTPDRLRGNARRILGDSEARRDRLACEVEDLRSALSEATHRAARLADVLADRPTSPTLLARLDSLEAQQGRLADQIRHKEAEIAYWQSYQLSDQDLEQLSDCLVRALEAGDARLARRALGSFLRAVRVDSGRMISANLCYTFPRPDDTPLPLPRRPTQVSARRRRKSRPAHPFTKKDEPSH